MTNDTGQEVVFELSTLIGSGNERDCWEHPHDPNLCIKTTKKGVRGRKQNKLDYHYYGILDRRNLEGPYLPACYGWCNTDRGPGLIFERIVWSNKNRSVSLLDAFENDWLSLEAAKALIDETFQWFLRNGVLITDYSPPHLVIREDDSGKLFLAMIDGVGGRRFGIKYFLQRNFAFLTFYKTRKVHRQAIRSTLFHYNRIKTDSPAEKGSTQQ